LTALLQQAGRPASDSEALVAALAADYRSAPIAEADRALLDYAAKLTRTPGAMAAEDTERLRAAGLDDRAIHDLCAIVGYFAFVNRIADGLGVELEQERPA
jgi:uncharacterized peroxidase-related enzyme